MRVPNAVICLAPRGQRGRGLGVGSPRLSNWEHCMSTSKKEDISIHAKNCTWELYWSVGSAGVAGQLGRTRRPLKSAKPLQRPKLHLITRPRRPTPVKVAVTNGNVP